MVEILLPFILGLYIPIIDSVDFLIRLLFRGRLRGSVNTVWPTSVQTIPPTPVVAPELRIIKPYKVLVSVHDIANEFSEFVVNMKPFGYEHVLVIDDASNDTTPLLLQQAGIPFMSNGTNRQKPGSILHGLETLAPEIETVIVMDPDARLLNLNPREFGKSISDFEEVLADFQHSGYDGCTVRVLSRCNSLLEYIQSFEYKISMGLARKSLNKFCFVSGAFAFFKRETLRRVLSDHSKSVYGEDYETSLRILAAGGHIYYDGRITVITQQRQTLWALTQQRMAWDFSLLKIHTQNVGKLFSLPKKFSLWYQFLVYNTLLAILLHPLRILSIGILGSSLLNIGDNLLHAQLIPDTILTDPGLFVLYYMFHLVVTCMWLLTIERRRRERYLNVIFVFPIYALYINFVPRTLGFLNYFGLITVRRKLFNDGYKYTD